MQEKEKKKKKKVVFIGERINRIQSRRKLVFSYETLKVNIGRSEGRK